MVQTLHPSIFISFGNRPGRRLYKIINTMTNLRNLLHCFAMGMGIKAISSTFLVSRNTVRKYVRKY